MPYARTDIGSVLSGKTPVGRTAEARPARRCTNICQTVALLVPGRSPTTSACRFVVIDTPFVYGDFQPHGLAFVAEQLEELGQAAARIAGRPAREVDIERVVGLAWRASQDVGRVPGRRAATGRRRGPPSTTSIHMAPIVALRGTQDCLDYYRELLAELDDRVADGVGASCRERHRVLWDNLPIWYRLRDLSKLFAERRRCLRLRHLHERMGASWEDFDPADRVGSTATMLSGVLLNRDLRNKLELMTGWSATSRPTA